MQRVALVLTFLACACQGEKLQTVQKEREEAPTSAPTPVATPGEYHETRGACRINGELHRGTDETKICGGGQTEGSCRSICNGQQSCSGFSLARDGSCCVTFTTVEPVWGTSDRLGWDCWVKQAPVWFALRHKSGKCVQPYGGSRNSRDPVLYDNCDSNADKILFEELQGQHGLLILRHTSGLAFCNSYGDFILSDGIGFNYNASIEQGYGFKELHGQRGYFALQSDHGGCVVPYGGSSNPGNNVRLVLDHQCDTNADKMLFKKVYAPTPAPPPIPLDTDVRIINVRTNRAIYAKRGYNGWNGFGAGVASSVGADGVWTIIQVSAGSYRIINKFSNRALWANDYPPTNPPVTGAGTASSVGADGVWTFTPKRGGYWIINNKTKGGLVDSFSVYSIDNQPFLDMRGVWKIEATTIATNVKTTALANHHGMPQMSKLPTVVSLAVGIASGTILTLVVVKNCRAETMAAGNRALLL